MRGAGAWRAVAWGVPPPARAAIGAPFFFGWPRAARRPHSPPPPSPVPPPPHPPPSFQATGVLDALDLAVQSAAIHRDGGAAPPRLAFRLADPASGGGPVPSPRRDGVRAALAALWGGGAGALSAPPAIYGVVAEAEVKRLRPLSSGGLDTSGAAALELAAAEMAAAAADLVSVEREVAAAAASRDAASVAGAASRRTEAAAVLERRMAAMEAALAARRTLAAVAADLAPPAVSPEREAASTATEADPFAAFRPPAVAGPSTSSGPAAGNGYELILQAFNWESHRGVAGPGGGGGERVSWYAHLAASVDAIAEAGFTSVWLPPPSDSVSPQGYLPRDLYKLDSAYGSEAELRALVGALRDRGVKAVADIVINHRCAHTQDGSGRWNRFGGRLPWDETAICCNNPAFGGRGAHKTGEDYTAAPNIDHTNPKVRADLAAWLAWLRSSIGFDGWRFDFVKGYAGSYAREYIDSTVPALAFGEFWDTCGYTDGVLDYNQDTHRQRTVNWCDATGGTAAAFDFTTKGILQEAMARGELWRLSDAAGRPPGVLGLVSWQREVGEEGRAREQGAREHARARAPPQAPPAPSSRSRSPLSPPRSPFPVALPGGDHAGKPRHRVHPQPLALPPQPPPRGARLHADPPGHALRVLGPLDGAGVGRPCQGAAQSPPVGRPARPVGRQDPAGGGGGVRGDHRRPGGRQDRAGRLVARRGGCGCGPAQVGAGDERAPVRAVAGGVPVKAEKGKRGAFFFHFVYFRDGAG